MRMSRGKRQAARLFKSGRAVFSFGLAILALSPLAAVAQEKAEIALVDQIVASSFVPQNSFLLYFQENVGVRKVPAAFVDQGANEQSSAERKLLLGSSIPVTLSNPEPLYSTFFLKGSETTFAATPIRSWTNVLLKENTQDRPSVQEEVVELRSRREQLSNALREVELSLRALRKQASQIAGVDEIIDLKLELSRIKGFGEQGGSEQGRLEKLIKLGRATKDIPEIDQQRLELTKQLQDTAQKTAMALRLQARRKQTAQQSLEKNLTLVRQMSRYDATALAQDIVRLRKQNADIRAQLGETAAPPAQDQF